MIPVDNMVPSENDMLENACANDAQGSMFVVGEGVNFLTRGDSYLARYITKIEGEDNFIRFPLGRFGRYKYKYHNNSILLYTTQFPNGKFTPIKLVIIINF